LEINSEKYFIGAVYIPPDGSNYLVDIKDILFELEVDILEYRKQGKVILMGDLNSQVYTYPSTINHNGKDISFFRYSQDAECKTLEPRGLHLMSTMNAINMVVMNGIDSGGEHTFRHLNIPTSVLDYIIISDNILLPGNEIKFLDKSIETIKSGPVDVYPGSTIPENSEYIHKSMKVYSDFKYIIGDHFLISCRIKMFRNHVGSDVIISKTDTTDHDTTDHDNVVDIKKWDRRDRGDLNYWKPMQQQLDKSLATWSDRFQCNSIDSLVNDFNESINDALSLSLKVRKNSENKTDHISWNQEIFKCKLDEKVAYENFKMSSIYDKATCNLELQTAKRLLRKVTRRVARTKMRVLIQNIEGLRSKDSRDYWRRLYDLDNSEPSDDKLPTHVKNSLGKLVDGKERSEAWRESFRKLGLETTDFNSFDNKFHINITCTIDNYINSSLDPITPTLDNPITLCEVKSVIKNLKRGKAVGIDGIMNEVFKYSGDEVATHLWKLYAYVFQSEVFPTDWARGLIFPLFKGGSAEFRYDPNKYRGITLLSIVGKAYTGILNDRLTSYLENNGILCDEQAGFRKNRSTVDQIFILSEAIINRRPKRTFVAFIDIAKAYDRVWRNGLWHKLIQMGIKGKMWRVLRNIYKHVESCVLLGKNRTDFFDIEVGLRQGCLLSPILFLIFLNDLVDEINKLGKGVKCGSKCVSILLFADDIALLAETKEDLELMLKTVYEFSLKWRFKFNYDKCAVIMFDNKATKSFSYGKCVNTCTCGFHVKFGENLIQQVLIYKYLGIELDNCLSFKVFKERLLHKAKTNMGRVYSMGIRSGFLSVKGSINLYQALVRSILEFSCELWGKDAWKDGENIQLEMSRRILRCSRKSTNEAVLGELGFWSLRARRNLKKIIYWFHILSLPNSRLLKQAYLMSRANPDKKSNFASTIHSILNKYQLLEVWKNDSKIWNLDGTGNNKAKSLPEHKRFWRNYLTKVVHKYEERDWRERMRRVPKAPKKPKVIDEEKQPKLRTYRSFKTHLRLEKYLMTSANYQGRALMTAIRIGTNKLQIERGRWIQQKRLERVCKQCSMNQVENEVHFVLLCPKYEELRQKLFQKIASISKNKWLLEKHPIKHRFVLLVNGTGDNFQLSIFSAFQSFIFRSFKLRTE